MALQENVITQSYAENIEFVQNFKKQKLAIIYLFKKIYILNFFWRSSVHKKIKINIQNSLSLMKKCERIFLNIIQQ